MRWLAIFILFSFLYFLRLFSVHPPQIPDQAQIKLTGRVIRQPYLKASKQIIDVDGFLIKTDPFPVYFYGQKLIVVGKIKKRVINRFKTEFIFYYPHIRSVEEKSTLANKTNLVKHLLLFKNRLEVIIEQLLPEPQSSLLAGILLGSKRQMPAEFFQNLRNTGTLHIVVASGYNITVVAGFLLAGLVWLVNRRWALILAGFGIIAYTLMAGAEPPVVRAAIMGGLTYLAQFLGRQKDAAASLFFAAAIMLLASPLILFDLGFQLSFLATAGILFIYPLIRGRIFRLPLGGDELKVTLAAQIATLPVLLASFGRVSALSPFINALVLPLVPLIMGLGAVMVAVGWLIMPLARIFAWLAWLPLTYLVKIINWFGRFSALALRVGELNIVWIASYYLILGLWVLKRRNKSEPLNAPPMPATTK